MDTLKMVRKVLARCKTPVVLAKFLATETVPDPPVRVRVFHGPGATDIHIAPLASAQVFDVVLMSFIPLLVTKSLFAHQAMFCMYVLYVCFVCILSKDIYLELLLGNLG